LATLCDLNNAEDIDKAQIAIHCFMPDRPRETDAHCAVLEVQRSTQLDRFGGLSISSGVVSAFRALRSPTIRSTTTW
jgi:hypothetical protein